MKNATIPLDARPIETARVNSRWARIGLAVAARPVTTIAILGCLITVGLLQVPLCSDVTWQLWIAHHLRMGARFYVDIIEVNPPLWFWMAIPIDATGEWLDIAPETLIVAAVGVAAILSLAATERLIRHIHVPRRIALLAYATLILLVMPVWLTEQREQLLLIASLPYVALAAARREARSVPSWIAIAIGIGAALGFALKHYFLGVPVLLELWLALGLRRGWRPIRAETLAVAAMGISYAAAVVLAAPEFLTRAVPLVRLAYGALGPDHLSALFQLSQCVWIGSIVVLAIDRKAIGRATPFTMALLVATAGFGAAWAIQHKGWTYHGIATSGGLAIAIAALMAETERRLNPAAPMMLIAPILLGWHGDDSIASSRKTLAPLAAEIRPGDIVGFIAPDPDAAWPFVGAQHLRYPSRYYSSWILASVIEHERGDHDPRLAAIGRDVVDNTVLDYRCTPPNRIVVFHTPHSADFDIYDFFQRRPAFRELMTHYRREQWVGQADIFRQISPLAAIPRTDCRRGV